VEALGRGGRQIGGRGLTIGFGQPRAELVAATAREAFFTFLAERVGHVLLVRPAAAGLRVRRHVRQVRASVVNEERKDMTVKRMDNVLIVVDDLEAAKAFFFELGLKLEGETTVEGPLVGSLIGLKDVRATLAMMRTPDGQGIELDKFHTPNAIRFGPVNAPVNTLGIRRIMFAVDDIDAVVARMRAHGAELIGEMQYEDTYRLAYIRGPEGIIVALSEQLG